MRYSRLIDKGVIMITFHGYENVIAGVYRHKQDHVFAFWEELSDGEKKSLLEDLASVDFEQLGKLYEMTLREEGHEADFEPASYIALPVDAQGRERFQAARKAGEEHIGMGKTAAFVVAGGQGSRLGYDGPKGMFSIGPVSGKSLFQIHAEKILKYSRKYGAAIPFLIMTSTANHEATVEFMRNNGNFGINDKDMFIFPQNMIPSLDLNGRLILEEKGKIFKNPDGHGGSLTALKTSGVLSELEKRGIETISYFQVDNPLVRNHRSGLYRLPPDGGSRYLQQGASEGGTRRENWRVCEILQREDGSRGIFRPSGASSRGKKS